MSNKATQIMKVISSLKTEHKRELEKVNKKMNKLKLELDNTRIKYRMLQKRHQKIHVLNSKLRKRISLHTQTLLSIKDSLVAGINRPDELANANRG